MKPSVNVSSPTGNVVFNFSGNPIHDLVPFARGYREAARVLAVRFRGDAYADYDGYPVLDLYRHSLELFLKAVVYRGAMVMELIEKEHPDVPGLFRNHGLKRLLPAVRAIFKAMQWDFKGTAFGTFDEFEKIIGHSAGQRLLVVSFTERDRRTRIISAREATTRERKDYEENRPKRST